MEFSADQLESNINRLTEDESIPVSFPSESSYQFDALDYARLTSKPPNHLDPWSADSSRREL